jgi:hypothetical protein
MLATCMHQTRGLSLMALQLSKGRNERRALVSEFKGTTMVNIREYYDKDGTMMPGSKVREPRDH